MYKSILWLSGLLLCLFLLGLYESVETKHDIDAIEVKEQKQEPLPSDTSPPYIDKNHKFSEFTQYVNNGSVYVLPEIKKFNKRRKETILCLALNIYHEARGSTDGDQKAVGYVTINRAKSEQYPDNICEVVWQQNFVDDKLIGQFSWTVKSTRDVMPKEVSSWIKSQKIALKVYKQKYSKNYTNKDITDGAMHFYAANLKKVPSWAKHNVSKVRIGQHIYVRFTNS